MLRTLRIVAAKIKSSSLRQTSKFLKYNAVDSSVVPVTHLSVPHEKSIAMKIILYYKTKQKQNYDIKKKEEKVTIYQIPD